jgi:predicted Zn-dependent protease
MRKIRLLLLVGASLTLVHAGSPANWSANYPPCNRHSELLSQGHMDLGVRLATANQILAQQFRHAMDTWASILDLDWHEDDTQNCSIQLVDGERQLFQPAAVAARSQLPDRLYFDGWIAFNPGQTLSEIELYRISLHEIGHVLGLQHSSNARSIMYSFNLDDQDWLDRADLAALAEHHKLRIAISDKPVKLTWTDHRRQ